MTLHRPKIVSKCASFAAREARTRNCHWHSIPGSQDVAHPRWKCCEPLGRKEQAFSPNAFDGDDVVAFKKQMHIVHVVHPDLMSRTNICKCASRRERFFHSVHKMERRPADKDTMLGRQGDIAPNRASDADWSERCRVLPIKLNTNMAHPLDALIPGVSC